MGENLQLLEILIFAVIAGILIFRLRSVLGRRTGNEQRRDRLGIGGAAPQPPSQPAAPIPLPSRPRLVASAGAALGDLGMAQLLNADPGFDRDAFLTGATAAFGIIVTAFAAGDRAKLQPLLSPDVFKNFVAAIEARERGGEKQETKIVAIKSADIAESKLQGDTAMVTVKFVSDQVHWTHDAAGKLIDGDPEKAIEQADLWTFARSVKSRDPNWLLLATKAPDHHA